MTKKQEEFYRKLCSTLGVTSGEIAHVGDHQVFDFEIPRMVGIDAYHYNPEGEKNGRVIVNFKNLLEWL
jgi:FMN phosphatase YigB (HAD superfamily)